MKLIVGETRRWRNSRSQNLQGRNSMSEENSVNMPQFSFIKALTIALSITQISPKCQVI